MRKILFVTDAAGLDVHPLDFACYVCKLTHSSLTGIFISAHSSPEKTALGAAVAREYPDTRVDALSTIYTEKAIRDFKQACETREANCVVHHDAAIPAKALIGGSRYADLIIADPALVFTGKQDGIPADFIREIISNAECPVITAPFRFEGADEIVFTYDGNFSSVYAMRQFTYLFPELRNLQVTVVCVTAPEEPASGDIAGLQEWLHIHYTHVQFLHLEDPRISNRLLEYLLGKKRCFIVMGAFGRNAVSEALFPSHARPVLQLVDQPVFIAHK